MDQEKHVFKRNFRIRGFRFADCLSSLAIPSDKSDSRPLSARRPRGSCTFRGGAVPYPVIAVCSTRVAHRLAQPFSFQMREWLSHRQPVERLEARKAPTKLMGEPQCMYNAPQVRPYPSPAYV